MGAEPGGQNLWCSIVALDWVYRRQKGTVYGHAHFFNPLELLLLLRPYGPVTWQSCVLIPPWYPDQQGKPPYFVLIEKALRDEGTSYHYLPPSDYSTIDNRLLTILDGAFGQLPVPVYRGATWTTDAPFRETTFAVEQAHLEGILAVEMEAAALYAFAQARHKPAVCFAHVTNQMGNVEGDFEKGEGNGSRDALQVMAITAKRWLSKYKQHKVS